MSKNFTGVDPRAALPSQIPVIPEDSPISPNDSRDAVEKTLLTLLDAFKPRVPSHSELVSDFNIPWILCGQQQVMDVIRGMLSIHRKESSHA